MLKEVLQKERRYVVHSDLHLGADKSKVKRVDGLLYLIWLCEIEKRHRTQGFSIRWERENCSMPPKPQPLGVPLKRLVSVLPPLEMEPL